MKPYTFACVVFVATTPALSVADGLYTLPDDGTWYTVEQWSAENGTQTFCAGKGVDCYLYPDFYRLVGHGNGFRETLVVCEEGWPPGGIQPSGPSAPAIGPGETYLACGRQGTGLLRPDDLQPDEPPSAPDTDPILPDDSFDITRIESRIFQTSRADAICPANTRVLIGQCSAFDSSGPLATTSGPYLDGVQGWSCSRPDIAVEIIAWAVCVRD